MKLEYAEIIHDIMEKELDVKYLAFLLERCDTNQVHDLVEQLNKEKREYDYVDDTAKDGLIKEVTLVSISDRMCKIQEEIEEL